MTSRDEADGSMVRSAPGRRLRAAIVLVLAGSLLSVAYNAIHPRGVFSALRSTPSATAGMSAGTTARNAAEGAGGLNTDAPNSTKAEAPKTEATEAGGPKPEARRAGATRAEATRAEATNPEAAKIPPPKTPRVTPAGPAPAPTAREADRASATADSASPVAAQAAPPAPPPASLTVVSPVEALRSFQQKSALFVDARSADRYALGHIPGALDLPLAEFRPALTRLQKSLPREARVIVYCESVDCDEAEQLCWALINEGYRGILLFKEGWARWETAGYPSESGAADAPR